MKETRDNVAAVQVAVQEEEGKQFEAHKYVDSLKPFVHPGLDEISLEVLSREYPPVNESQEEKEIKDAFRKHLETLEPKLSAENIVEVRSILGHIATPIVGGKLAAGGHLTVGDLKQLDDRYLKALGLADYQVSIPRRLFPRS